MRTLAKVHELLSPAIEIAATLAKPAFAG